jgi:hypothetical protein
MLVDADVDEVVEVDVLLELDEVDDEVVVEVLVLEVEEVVEVEDPPPALTKAPDPLFCALMVATLAYWTPA